MKERDYIIRLFDIYGNLFTNKQVTYFKEYYFEDLSLSEIADKYSVSKSIVSRTINNVENKLKKYENVLKVLELKEKIDELKSKKTV